MIAVTFAEIQDVDDALLAYPVIVSRHQGQWLFCQHRDRDTWEIPGGRREPGEDILFTARRELFEETGADDFDLQPLCAYVVDNGGAVSYGLLCCADIRHLAPLPPSEIARVQRFDAPPAALTYPQIQPLLWEKARQCYDRH